MTPRQLREQEVKIKRYRLLEQEVTDPLAAHLLHSIVEELETELRGERDSSLRQLVEQCHSLLQVQRVKALGEPAVDRS